jgi:hypothetical protein
MHSETVCGCVPRRRKRLCAYCFILLHTKKKEEEEGGCVPKGGCVPIEVIAQREREKGDLLIVCAGVCSFD